MIGSSVICSARTTGMTHTKHDDGSESYFIPGTSSSVKKTTSSSTQQDTVRSTVTDFSYPSGTVVIENFGPSKDTRIHFK
jgi:hypothetical protein